MAYHNPNHYYHGWNAPSNDYQICEPTVGQPALHRRYDNPRHPKPKGHHGAFRTNLVESIPETTETSTYPSARLDLQQTEDALNRMRHSNDNGFESVDQEADMFIKLEHRRMELTKLMSMRAA